MLAVRVAAYRKKLILSVGLCCLPYAAFGMDEYSMSFGISFVDSGSKFGRGILKNKSLHKPNHSEVPTKRSINSRRTTRRVALPFVQAEIQTNSLPIDQADQQRQPLIINDNVALERPKIDVARTPQTRTDPLQSQTVSSRINNKRAALPFLSQKNQHLSLPESQQGKQNSKIIESFVPQQGHPLIVHNLCEPRKKTTDLFQSQTLSPSRLWTVNQRLTAFESPQKEKPSTSKNNLYTSASKKQQSAAAVPTHANLKRSETIQPNLFSIFLSSKAEILNENIPNLFNAMGDYRATTSMTPLESLAFTFYIKMTEARCIRLMDLDPDLNMDEEKIKSRELALFCDEDGVLCCQTKGKENFKIVKSDDPMVLGYEADSFDRVLTALKDLTDGRSHRYNIALQQEEQVQRAILDINKDNGGPEILAAWDTERLFQYLSLCGYSLKAKGIKPWPAIIGEQIKEINPKELLDKFWKLDKNWNYSFAKNLGASELAKISQNTLELISSSATYLTETIKTLQAKDEVKENKAEAQLKQLYQTLRYCYSELSKRFTLNEEYHYYNAKYLTELECYKEAWNHISQCTPYLQNSDLEDGEIKWLKWLQYNHSTILKKQMASSENQGKNYFEIANFTQMISILDNKNYRNKQKNGDYLRSSSADDKPDLDAVCYYLESLKNYYDANSITRVMGKIKEINQLSPDILFHVACKAYDVAKDDKKDTDMLLCISHNCFFTLIEQKSNLNHEWGSIIETVLNSTYSPKTKEFSKQMSLSDSILKEPLEQMQQRAIILSSMGKVIWNADQKNDVAKSLYLSAANLFYYIGYSSEEYDAKKQCSKWNNKIIENVIEASICSGSPVADIPIDYKIINELCRVLVDRKYRTEVYQSALAHLKKREKWVTAFNLAQSATNFIPSLKKKEFDQLKEEIILTYNSIQRRKKFFGETFMAMTDMLTQKKNISAEQVKNWTEDCHLITVEQLYKLNSNLNRLIDRQQLYLSLLKEGAYYMVGHNFFVLEQEDYMKKVYENFDLALPQEKWVPEKYVNLGESQKNDFFSFAPISQDPHGKTESNVIEVKKNGEQPEETVNQTIRLAIRKGHARGTTIEVLSSMFDLREEQIKEILK